MRARYGEPRTSPGPERRLAVLPVRAALLAEGGDPLAEVLREEARLAQLDQFALELGGQRPRVLAQCAYGPLVARERQRRVGADLGGEPESGLLQSFGLDDRIDQTHLVAAVGVDVPAEQEELVRIGHPAHVDELLKPGVGVDEADLRRWHPQLHAARGDAQVAG